MVIRKNLYKYVCASLYDGSCIQTVYIPEKSVTQIIIAVIAKVSDMLLFTQGVVQ